MLEGDELLKESQFPGGGVLQVNSVTQGLKFVHLDQQRTCLGSLQNSASSPRPESNIPPVPLKECHRGAF